MNDGKPAVKVEVSGCGGTMPMCTYMSHKHQSSAYLRNACKHPPIYICVYYGWTEYHSMVGSLSQSSYSFIHPNWSGIRHAACATEHSTARSFTASPTGQKTFFELPFSGSSKSPPCPSNRNPTLLDMLTKPQAEPSETSCTTRSARLPWTEEKNPCKQLKVSDFLKLTLQI